MNLRDITWSEYLRNKDAEYHDDLLNDFAEMLKNPVLSYEQREKLKLVSRFLMWNLTSTDPNLKKKLSQGLYEFGSISFLASCSRISLGRPSLTSHISIAAA